MTPSIVQSAVLVALGSFLQNILPPGVSVVEGQVNRVAPPATGSSPDYVVMTPFARGRFATNVDGWQDVLFTAEISGNLMTVSEVAFGTILEGATIFFFGVPPGVTIVSFGTGTGSVGTYHLSTIPDAASQEMAAGTLSIEQSTELVINAEVHGPNSADNAQVITTLFRDEYATSFPTFADGGISPLYADDPKQVPFPVAQDQYEERWIVGLHLQITPAIVVPQQYAGAATVATVDVTTLPI